MILWTLVHLSRKISNRLRPKENLNILRYAAPSLCWVAFGDKYRTKHNKTYYEFYTEKIANDLVGLDKYRHFK